MNDRRRALPAVNTLLAEAERSGLMSRAPRAVVADAIRDALASARAQGGVPPTEGWVEALTRRLETRQRRSLVRVINATGVVLHTNLGRAPLSEAARAAAADAAGYCALEYDLVDGDRGSRQDHTRAMLQEITGAEDGFVTTNAAAALFLALQTLADKGEAIVSRGELVEIGGGFRIPEILARAGSVLCEVGTTNRTRLADYEQALGARTGCALKVHRSNFALSGFVTEVEVTDLIRLMTPRGIPVVHDIGSGLIIDLSPFGLTGEPLLRESVASGALTVCSGDKLLGGPQAGIIVGPASLVSRIATNPLARALRPDKTIVAALEATLAAYRDPETARREIPVLAMLTADAADLRRRAKQLARRIPGSTTIPGKSEVGGGSFPGAELATTLVAVPVASCDTALAALRAGSPPVIARASEDRVVLDVRTLGQDEIEVVAEAMRGLSLA